MISSLIILSNDFTNHTGAKDKEKLLSFTEHEKKNTGICFQFAKGICKRGDECKYKHIKDESNKEKQEQKSKFPNKNGKNQNNTTPTTSQAGPLTFNHRQHYIDKIGPGKSTITPSNPKGYSNTQRKMYQFVISSEAESGENNIDYGNENMKILKMGSLLKHQHVPEKVMIVLKMMKVMTNVRQVFVHQR